MPRKPADFVPLSNLSFHVLLVLGDGASHGYAIGQEVEDWSDGKLSPTTGALYQALRRLDEDGLIEAANAPGAAPTDTRRQYFKLTRLGRRVVALEASRLEQLVAVARAKNLYRERLKG